MWVTGSFRSYRRREAEFFAGGFYLFLLLFVLVGSLAGLILERTLSRRIEAAVSDQLWSLTGVARNAQPDGLAMTPWSSTRSSIRSPKKPALCWRS